MKKRISIAAALSVLAVLSVFVLTGTPTTSADPAQETSSEPEPELTYETCGGPRGCVSGCGCGCGGNPTLCGCGG